MENTKYKYMKYKNKFLNLRKQIEEFNLILEDRKTKGFLDPKNKNKYTLLKESIFNVINEDRKTEGFLDPINKNKFLNLRKQIEELKGGSSSIAPVKVLLLPEVHENIACSKTNTSIINNFLINLAKQDSSSLDKFKQRLIVVSEGRGINPCYQALRVPVDRIITEHDNSIQTKTEVIDKFLLYFELWDSILYTTDFPYTKEFIMDHAINDGFRPLLKAIKKSGEKDEKILSDLLNSAYAKDRPNYERQLADLFASVVRIYLADEPDFKKMVEGLIGLDHRTRIHLLKTIIFPRFREKRDSDIMERINSKINSEPSIDIVIIIYGLAHYDNLTRLINSNPRLVKLYKCQVCDIFTSTKCQRCKAVYYCCRECQVKDWSKHKNVCKQ
jgi:hypothetical protein